MRPLKLEVLAAAIALPVSHWDRSLAWYTQTLGCRVGRVDLSIGEVVELRFGLQHFSLWLDWGDPRIPRADPSQVRTTSLCLVVLSLAAARRTLTARGAKLRRSPTGLLLLDDPDGNELSLHEAPRVRPTVGSTRRGVAHVLEMDRYRAALSAAMAKGGIDCFESVRALRDFERTHGLRRPPLPERRGPSEPPRPRRR